MEPLFAKLIPSRESKILVVGCGNSLLSEHMYDIGGYHNITNIDYEEKVVESMSERSKNRQGMSYLKMDMLDLSSFGD